MGKRVFLIVLDSAGVGEAPDADRFDDVGCDTMGTCVRSGKLKVPNMTKLGLFNLDDTSFKNPVDDVIGCYGKMTEKSAGKDTTVGHWEIAGLISRQAMPTYPDGFPKEIMDEFEKQTGRGTLCNKPYSGSVVIADYGKEHMETGKLIVYTSADSVFQIAAHEEIVPVEELYKYCKIARNILQGEHGVGRVIARPFIGEHPFTRTVNRHDFSLEPPRVTMLDTLKAAGRDTIGVGKIYDIFAGRGLTETTPNKGNDINMEVTLKYLDKDFEGVCFVNLVDFDMMYGHRNDIEGYTNALNKFDEQLGTVLEKMREEDLLIITADHGCDPGFKGTDHSREYTPCLCYGEKLKQGVNLGTRESFADIAKTVTEYLGVPFDGDGESFLGEIMK
ncbi:MAG: phosphopentomutase [Ruminococcus sp.]|nr:phosphopentomutase [Ruminococcus sp.]